MPLDVNWVVTIPAEAIKESIRNQIYLALVDIYAKDIKPRAQELSPYLTGNNAESIDYEVHRLQNSVVAELFSQSGYGGYLELGTSKMRARPYLYPAWNEYRDDIGEAIGARIRVIRKVSGALR